MATSAFDEALCIADRLGLAAHDCDGYLGFADLAGASEKQLALIAHTDVVPEGPGWHTDPFKMEQREGWLLGRGVIDDKGPAVLALHAARFFAERVEQTGEKLPYTLRVILGANEETSMGDVDYYLENYPEPDFLFTPDAEFPVCCGEKGLYGATFRSPAVSGPVEGSVIAAIEGGSATNAIASLAVAVVRAGADGLPAADGIEVEDASEGGQALARITAHGVGGHASTPAGTKNAIGMLCNYLLENGLFSEAERPFLGLERQIHAATAACSASPSAPSWSSSARSTPPPTAPTWALPPPTTSLSRSPASAEPCASPRRGSSSRRWTRASPSPPRARRSTPSLPASLRSTAAPLSPTAPFRPST